MKLFFLFLVSSFLSSHALALPSWPMCKEGSVHYYKDSFVKDNSEDLSTYDLSSVNKDEFAKIASGVNQVMNVKNKKLCDAYPADGASYLIESGRACDTNCSAIGSKLSLPKSNIYACQYICNKRMDELRIYLDGVVEGEAAQNSRLKSCMTSLEEVQSTIEHAHVSNKFRNAVKENIAPILKQIEKSHSSKGKRQ